MLLKRNMLASRFYNKLHTLLHNYNKEDVTMLKGNFDA